MGAKKLKVPLWGEADGQCANQLNYNLQLIVASQRAIDIYSQMLYLQRIWIDVDVRWMLVSLQLAGDIPLFSLLNSLYLTRDSLLWFLCCYFLLLIGRLPTVGTIASQLGQLAKLTSLLMQCAVVCVVQCSYLNLAQSWEQE